MKHTKQRTSLLSAAIIAVCASISLPSFADTESTTWFGEESDGTWLAGIKFGVTENNAPGYDSASTATLVVGYQFSRPVGEGGTASVELELAASEDARIGPGNDFGVNGDWDGDGGDGHASNKGDKHRPGRVDKSHYHNRYYFFDYLLVLHLFVPLLF